MFQSKPALLATALLIVPTAWTRSVSTIPTAENAGFVIQQRPPLPPPPPPPPDEPIRIASTLAARRILENPDPEYPPLARRARVQGIVILEADIDTEGTVTEVRVIGGPELLQQAAVDAVRRWRYEPYLLNGQAVPFVATVTVNFRLPEEEGEEPR